MPCRINKKMSYSISYIFKGKQETYEESGYEFGKEIRSRCM